MADRALGRRKLLFGCLEAGLLRWRAFLAIAVLSFLFRNKISPSCLLLLLCDFQIWLMVSKGEKIVFRLSAKPALSPRAVPETLLAARVLISMSYNQSNYILVWRIKSDMVSAEEKPNYKFNSSGNATDSVASLLGLAGHFDCFDRSEHLRDSRNRSEESTCWTYKASPSLLQCYRDNAKTCCNSAVDDVVKEWYGALFTDSCKRNFPVSCFLCCFRIPASL